MTEPAVELVTRSAGRYRTLRPLGSGASGQVVLALDLFEGREVAVKRFAADRREQALVEAGVLLGIHDPGLVAATDVCVDPADGTLQVCFPFVSGTPFCTALRGATFPEIALVAAQVLRAVGVLHRRGLVHRDLKPDNVLVAGAGAERTAHVIDFGFTRPAAATGAGAGTVAYMAPEVLDGRPADARSDLFSFGLMLYEVIAGRLPTQGQHDVDLVRTQRAADFRLPPDSAARAPGALAELVRHLLRRDPALRPASAIDVLEGLAAATEQVLPLETPQSLASKIAALELTRDAADRAGLAERLRAATGVLHVLAPAGAEREIARQVRALCARELRPVVDVDPAELAALASPAVCASLPRAAVALVCGAAAAPTALVGRGDVLVVHLSAATDALPPAAIVVASPALGEVERAARDQLGLEAPAAWLERLRSRAGFVPAAVRAALHAALVQGVLVVERGRIRLDAAQVHERLELPPDAGASSEVARLSGSRQEILRACAETTLPAPAHAARDAIGAPADWDALVELGMLVPAEGSSPGALVLLRDDLAAAVRRARPARAAHVAALAAALESRAADDPIAAGEAGRLWIATGDGARARRLLLDAGIRLRRLGRAREARAVLERIVGLDAASAAAPDRLEALRWIADCHYLEGDDDAALAAIERARGLEGQADVHALLGAVEARVHARRGRIDVALACVERALVRAGASPTTRGLLLLTRSHLLKEGGHVESALAAADEALALLPSEATLERASALNVRANALSELGRVDEAVVAYVEAERLARGAGRRDLAALALANHAAIRFDCGEMGKAIAVLEPALAEFRSAGELRHVETLIVTLVGAHVARGEIAAARGLANVVAACFDGGGAPRNGALAMRRLAEAELRAGSAADAERWLARSAAAERSIRRDAGLALIEMLEAGTRAWRGDRSAARAGAARALRALARARASDDFLDASAALAEMHLGERRFGAALCVTRRALTRSRAELKPQRRAQLLALAAAAERESGDPGTALVLADTALRGLRESADGLLRAALVGQRAAALAALGRDDEADAAFATALDALVAEGAALERARALQARAEWNLRRARRLGSDGSRAGAGHVAALLSSVRDDLERAVSAQRTAGHVPLGEDLARVAKGLDTGARARPAGRPEFAGLERRLIGLERLLEVTKAVNTELDPDRLLAIMLDAAIELSGAHRGFVILTQDGKVDVRAARNFVEQDVKNPEFEISHSVARRVAVSGQPILTSNALRDQRLRSISSIAELRVLSILCVPLVSHDAVLGSLYIDHPDLVDRFDRGDLDLLTDFAQVAGIALERARLHRENAERAAQLADANARIAQHNLGLMDTVAAQARELVDVKDVLAAERRATANRYDYAAIVSRSAPMRDVLALLDRVTDTNFPVLILGESGTGKELVARALHSNGPRREKAFVSVNCAAMTETLIEAELFGFVRGAFTGAERDREGLFEVAHHGTLFLDEIGDMSLELQSRLLRAIQSGEFFRVGGRTSIRVDVRVIAATHRNLQELIQRGRFREDLYYRLNVAQVRLPPLRERAGDIPLLVQHFAAEAAQELGVAQKTFSRAALAAIERYAWPGNVRELQNEVRRLTALLDAKHAVAVADLSDGIRQRAEEAPEPILDKTWKELMEAQERRVLAHALRACAGNKAEAAKRLGITLRGLYKILERHGGVAGLLPDGA